MKLFIEEIERRQQYHITNPPEDKREKGRGGDQGKVKEGIAVQLGEGELIEWTVYVYPKGEDPWRKGARLTSIN